MSYYNPHKFAEWLSNAYADSKYKSWQQVADEIGTTRSTLSRYAGAKPQTLTDKPSQPSPELAIKLANLFNDDVDNVLMLAGHAPQNKTKNLPEELQIMDYDGFDKNDLKEIAEYIEFKRQQKLKESKEKIT